MKFELKLPFRRSRQDAGAGPALSRTSDADGPHDEPATGGSVLSRLFDRKRMIRITALLFVAAAAGQLMQGFGGKTAPQAHAAVSPSAPQPLAAPAEPAPEVVAAALSAPAPQPLPQEAPQTSPESETLLTMVQPADAAPSALEAVLQLDGTAPTERAALPAAPATPSADLMITADEGTPVLVAATSEPPAVLSPAEAPMPQPLVAEACPVSLDLAAAPGAVIKITLTAPCAPNARVVLMHEGLAITGLTTSSGALFAALPALTGSATVEAQFSDGTGALASLYLPEATKFRRFGVQWQGDDAFQLQAYLNGAGLGSAGHVNAARTGMASDAGGFLQVLGDPSAPMPLLAEVYTYPVGADPVDLQVESAVTFKTCDRELLAETVTAQGGTVYVGDLALAMPDCTATGDILVLKNLALDMTLASN